MALADRSVLSAVLERVLSTDIIAEAIERAALAIEREDAAATDASGLTNELATVQAELQHLTAAVAAGGDVPTLLEALRIREARRRDIEDAIATASRQRPTVDHRDLRATLRASIRNWRALLRRTAPAGQQALRALIVDRLTVTPQRDDSGPYYAFHGLGTVAPIVGKVAGDLCRMSIPGGDANFCTNVPIRGEMRVSA